MNFYTLIKIADRRNPPKDLPNELPLIKARGALVSVPSDEAFKLMKLKKEDLSQEDLDKAAILLQAGKLYIEQDTLIPIIGRPLLFESFKSWFRTSQVENFNILPNGDVSITTSNSIYLAELDKDDDD